MQIGPIIERVVDEIRGAWRFRWPGIIAAWVVCVVGWLAVFSLPQVYEANARVYVDTKGILRPLLQGLAIDPEVASGLDLVRQVLLSRPQIELVDDDHAGRGELILRHHHDGRDLQLSHAVSYTHLTLPTNREV